MVGPADECAYSSSKSQMKRHIHLFLEDDLAGWLGAIVIGKHSRD
jgi:hypothetical protein